MTKKKLAREVTPSLVISAFLGIILVTATQTRVVWAQSSGSIKTDLGVYLEPPAPALPVAGGKLIDPIFGTEIMRVTDANNAPAGAGTAYSYWPTFNKNSTRLIVNYADSVPRIYDFDPGTFSLGASSTIPPPPATAAGFLPAMYEDAIWSGIDPNTLFVHRGVAVFAYDVGIRAYTPVFDLSDRLPSGSYFFQMSRSMNDDVFAFTLRDANYRVAGYVAYRRSTNSILVDQRTSQLDEVQIDKSGRFLLVKTGLQGPSMIEVRVFDLSTGGITDLTDNAPDFAPGHSDNGTGTVIGGENWTPRILGRQLATPHQFWTVTPNDGTWTNDGHVSMLADNEDWALMSFFGTALPGILEREIVQAATDGSLRIRRLAHHHSIYQNYDDTPRANISRDGRFVAFTSNWGIAGGRHDLFIAKIDSAGSPTATPSPTPASTPTPTPTPSATPSTNVSFVRLDTGTEGNWKNDYGAEGYNTVNDSVKYPSYAQVAVTGYSSPTWVASTTDVRGLQKASASDRVAARWDSGSFITVDLNLTDGLSHQVAIYGLDWDGNNRSQRVDVLDWATNALLDSRTISSFNGGQYLVWNIRGHVKITVNRTGAKSAVVSGLYFGGSTTNPLPTPTATPTPTPSPSQNLGKSVGKAKRNGQNLSNLLASSDGSAELSGSNELLVQQSAQTGLMEFVSDIQQAYDFFNAERNLYPAATKIEGALKRAFDAAFQAELSGAVGDVTRVKSQLREAINNLELSDVLIAYGDIPNPIDVSSYMVRQQYVDFLNREPDQAGSDFWGSQLQGCGTNSDCVEMKRVNVSASFFLSIEFQQSGYFVYRLYKSSYGRVPLLREFLQDQDAVARGVMVGTDGWAAKLAANQERFIQDWAQRVDFQARYSGLTNEQYVDALIANVGTTLTTVERDELIRELVNGNSRTDVLRKLVENPTFSRNEFNSAFVLMQYFGYLRRDPDADGYNFWLRKLNDFDGNYVNADMVKAFLRSTEYRNRFGL